MTIKLKIIIVINFFLFFNFSISQNISFKKTYGNIGYDFGRGLIQLKNSSYLITGSSSSNQSISTDVILLHTDSLGNVLSNHYYGGEQTDWGEKIVIGKDSSIAICGYSNSIGKGGFDFYLLVLNQDKSIKYQKSYGGTDWDFAYDIAPLQDSGYILVGETQSFGAINSDAYMVRVNKFGDTIWTKKFGGIGKDSYRRIKMIDTDTFLVVGYYQHPDSTNIDGLIQKVSIDGEIVWQENIGGKFDDYLYTVDTSKNKYLFAGTLGISDSFSRTVFYGYEHNYQQKFRNTSYYNNGVWEVRDMIYRPSSNSVVSVFEVADNEIPTFLNGNDILVSTNEVVGGWHDFVLNERLGKEGNDEAREIILTRDNGVAIVGSNVEFSNGGSNIMLVKYDSTLESLGNENWNINLTLEIPKPKNDINIHIYPNPIKNFIYIKSNIKYEKALILGTNGQVLVHKRINENKISTPHQLKNGVYILVLMNNNTTLSKKIIINR